MYILAVETTGQEASAAIIDENREIRQERSGETRSHLQNIVPMIDKLMKKSELLINDIDYIAVSEGPGSFTGIRIGMATAKSLCQALDKKIIPVPTLKSFAYNAQQYKGLICPIFDARRNQVYGGAYCWNDGKIVSKVADGAYDINEFLNLAGGQAEDTGGKLTFFGDGTDIYKDIIEDWNLNIYSQSLNGDVSFGADEVKLQNASSIGLLALDLLREGMAVDYREAEPVYLRKAEAQRKLEERMKLDGI